MIITALILQAVIMALGIDPQTPISVSNVTFYYGIYAESVINNTVVYTGININNTLSIIVVDNAQLPINMTYTLNVGNYLSKGSKTLQPGSNVVNITVPALPQGTYNASLRISVIGYSITYHFTVVSLVPGIKVSSMITKLYSGLPQQVSISIINATPIPIDSVSIVVIGINSEVSTSTISAKPPTQIRMTITPGSYLKGNATLMLKAVYVDAGGYTWTQNYTLAFTVVQTPVKLTINATSPVSYGSSLPITIKALTPIGPLSNQQMLIYVDNNYITSVLTNSNGVATYSLPINYSVGYHTLTVAFTNTTYFQRATVNYTFIVVPGTVYIIAYTNSSNIMYGNTISINIWLSPPISGGTLTISYVINGQSSTIGSYTPVNGRVQVTWTPPQAGTYIITIYYQNPPDYLPSSTNLTLTVNKALCTLSILISGTPEVFHSVSIIGIMKPAIINAGINILITGQGSSFSGLMYINSSGVGKYVFTPQLPGQYNIVISWPGNINYKACSSTTQLNIGKASLNMTIHEESRGLIASGGYITFRLNLTTDIPINYVSGNIIIMVERGNKTVNTLTVPITSNNLTSTILFYKPGNYRVMIMYPGNEYVNSVTYGPYYVTVLPGLFGIPWYILTAYLLPLGLGMIIGIMVNRKLYEGNRASNHG